MCKIRTGVYQRLSAFFFLLTFCAPFSTVAQEQPIDYSAKDSIASDVAAGTVELFNEVKISFGETQLSAGYAKIYWDEHRVEARGIQSEDGSWSQRPVFQDGGRTFYLGEIAYNWTTNKAKITAVLTQEGENFLNGQAVKKVDSNTMYMAGTGFTTCSHETPHFQIKTNKSKVELGERIITGPAHFEFFGIPTPLIIPYGYFPTNIEKPSISGLLMPSFQNSPTQGVGLVNGGWYFPINEYFDLALRGDVYLRGSWALGATTNYRRRYKYNGNLAYQYRYQKQGLPIFEQFGGYNITKNFSIRWTHNQDPKAHPTRKFSAQVNLQNPNFFKNSANPEDLLNGNMTTTNNTMNSSITYNQKLGIANLTVSGNHSQNNGTQAFTTTLPKASLNFPRFFPLKTNDGKSQWYDKIGVNMSSVAEGRLKGNLGTISDQLDTLNNYDWLDVLGDYGQYGLKHTAAVSTNATLFKYITFSPNANITERWYFQQYDYTWDSTLNKATLTDTIPGFTGVRDFGMNASFNTKIYGTFLFSRGPVKAVRHMITPRATVNYRPDFGAERWNYYQNFSDTLGNELYYNRYNGFLYGSPGRGSNGTITFNLDNNLEAKVVDRADSTGATKKISILERFNVSTNYNMNASNGYHWNVVRVTAQSALFNKKLRLSYQGQFDPYGYDQHGDRITDLAFTMGQAPLIHRTSQFSASTQLRSNRKNSRQPIMYEQRGGAFTEGDIDYYHYPDVVGLRSDWDVNIRYDFRIVTNVEEALAGDDAPQFMHEFSAHSLSLSGSYQPTDHWSLNYQTGVDIAQRTAAFTTIRAVRDLHCWQMNISWVPFGNTRSYMIGINLKNQQFRQVKAQRRRTAIDF